MITNDLTDQEFGGLIDIGVAWQIAGRPVHPFDSDDRSPARCRQCARSRFQHGDGAGVAT